VTEHDGKLYGLGTADMKGFLRLSLMRYAMSTSRSLQNRSTFWRLPMKNQYGRSALFAETTALRRIAPSLASQRRCNRYARIKVISLTPSVFRASRATPAIQHAELTLSN